MVISFEKLLQAMRFFISIGSRSTIILTLIILKFICTLLALYVFTKFSPLVDVEQYLLGGYSNHASFRTHLVQNIVRIFSAFSGPVGINFLFGVISLLGLMYYYFRGGTRWQLCAIMFLPSSLIWTSVIGKEAIFYGAFSLLIVIWVQFIHRRFSLLDLGLLIPSLVFCFVLRPHYGLVIPWLFMSVILIDKFHTKAWIFLSLIVGLSYALISGYLWDTMLLYGFYGIDPDARASRFISFGIDPLTWGGVEKYKTLLPLGAILGIVGPTPSEVFSRPILVPFLIEGLLILIFPALVYLYAVRQSFMEQNRFKIIFWMSLVPAIIMLIILHSPFGVLNPGSATRWRVNFELLFYMAPMLLLFSFLDNKSRENSSLSS